MVALKYFTNLHGIVDRRISYRHRVRRIYKAEDNLIINPQATNLVIFAFAVGPGKSIRSSSQGGLEVGCVVSTPWLPWNPSSQQPGSSCCQRSLHKKGLSAGQLLKAAGEGTKGDEEKRYMQIQIVVMYLYDSYDPYSALSAMLNSSLDKYRRRIGCSPKGESSEEEVTHEIN